MQVGIVCLCVCDSADFAEWTYMSIVCVWMLDSDNVAKSIHMEPV